MHFLNPYLLIALAGVAIPVIIHLFNRRHAREINWGAMRFLLGSLLKRRRNLLLEEMLLLATRCLLVGAAVLAIARPFEPPGSALPWWLMMPLSVAAIILFGCSFALTRHRRWKRGCWYGALLCAALCALTPRLEKTFGWKGKSSVAEKELAIVIDGSSSMEIAENGESNFELAKREAAKLIESAPRNTAFSIIVSGAVPVPIIPVPRSDRKYLLNALSEAIPVHGLMNVPDTLAAAPATLAQSSRPANQIVLFGDGQAVGWETSKLERWQCLDQAFAQLPQPPKISVRTFKLPPGIRNVAIKSISFSRAMVGTDRPVGIEVTLANTGQEAVTPEKVVLVAEGEELTDRSVSQMPPGSESSVTFTHTFKTAGAQVVQAKVSVTDELAADNRIARVLQVIDRIPVLVVDDGREVRPLDRDGGYISLALQPFSAMFAAETSGVADNRLLMRPELIAAPDLGLRRGFPDVPVIILADVPALPQSVAQKIADFVRGGGRLLVTHGAKSSAEFYNTWTSGGESVMPLHLGECVIAAGRDVPTIDIASFRHPALSLFRKQGDLSGTPIECYRTAETPDKAKIFATLRNGAPMLAEHQFGRGLVLQLMIPLDPTCGPLVSRQAFLPLVHELTSYLAQPMVANLNLPPSLDAVIRLGAPVNGGHGLTGEYRRRDDPNRRFKRIDPGLCLRWNNRSPNKDFPRDNYRVEWSGSLIPSATGKFRFTLTGDDRTSLEIGNKLSLKSQFYNSSDSGEIDLRADTVYPISASLEQDGGEAFINVTVEGPGLSPTPLPENWLLPIRNTKTDSWREAVAVTITNAANSVINAKIRQNADGIAMRVEQPLLQGLHIVNLPESVQEWLPQLTGEKDSFPLCVMENAGESNFEPLSDDERAILTRLAPIAFADSYEELELSLAGKSFGRELWRIPAMLLFILLISECFLTRWITKNRQ